MSKRRSLVVTVALAMAGTHGAAHADSAWATRSELGFVMARGNSDTESGTFKFDTAHAIGRWKYTWGLSTLFADSNNIRTAQRWDTHLQTDLNFSDRSYWFAAVRYEDDRFSGFAYQESFSTGAGHSFIKTDTTKLSAQLGAGIRKLEPEVLTRDPNTNAVLSRTKLAPTSDAVANAAITFEHAFTPSTKLINLLLAESGQSNTSAKENLSLQVKMNSSLALAVGWQLFYNSNPPGTVAVGASPVAVKRTDTVTTINLVYELKNPNLTPTPTAFKAPGAEPTALAK